MTDARMLKAPEAARFLGVSLATFKRLRAEQRIPKPSWNEAGQKGRPSIVRWDRTHLELWLDSGRPDELKFDAELRRGRKRSA